MPEPNVQCGCGRIMNPDAPRGRGAYRCGCGTRVRVTTTVSTDQRCVGTHRGEPCRLRPAINDPLPLCDDHFTSTGLRRYASWWQHPDDQLAELIAEEFTRIHLRSAAPGAVNDTALDDYFTNQERQLAHQQSEAGRLWARQRADNDHETDGVVYFIRSGDAVKIGKTTNLARRRQQISAPNAELMATEPGYTRRERQLHRRFAIHRINGEWFLLAPPLTAYINALREAQTPPPASADVPAGQDPKS